MSWMWDKVELNVRPIRLSSRDLFILSPCLETSPHSFLCPVPETTQKDFLRLQSISLRIETGLCLCIFEGIIAVWIDPAVDRWYFLYVHTIHNTWSHVWATEAEREEKFVLSFMATSMNSDYKILSLLLFAPFTNIILTNISGRWVMLCSSVFGRAAKKVDTINLNQFNGSLILSWLSNGNIAKLCEARRETTDMRRLRSSLTLDTVPVTCPLFLDHSSILWCS